MTEGKQKNKPIFTGLALIIVLALLAKNLLGPKNVKLEVFEDGLYKNKISSVVLKEKTTEFKVSNKTYRTEALDNKLKKDLIQSGLDYERVFDEFKPPIFILIPIFGLLLFLGLMFKRLNAIKTYRNFKYLKDPLPIRDPEDLGQDSFPKGLEPILNLTDYYNSTSLNRDLLPNIFSLELDEKNPTIVKLISQSLNLSYYYIDMVELYNLFRMVGAYRLRSYFEAASKNKPCIIYLDTNVYEEDLVKLKDKRLYVKDKGPVDFPSQEKRLIFLELKKAMEVLDKDLLLVVQHEPNNSDFNSIFEKEDFQVQMKI